MKKIIIILVNFIIAVGICSCNKNHYESYHSIQCDTVFEYNNIKNEISLTFVDVGFENGEHQYGLTYTLTRIEMDSYEMIEQKQNKYLYSDINDLIYDLNSLKENFFSVDKSWNWFDTNWTHKILIGNIRYETTRMLLCKDFVGKIIDEVNKYYNEN